MVTKIKYSKNTLAETYYNIISQRIIHDEYGEGDIITEKTLVEEFGVSKSPIREALIKLCNENLLKSIPRFGYEIISISQERIRQVIDFRIILECGSLEKNWNKLTDEKVFELSKLISNVPERMEAVDHWKRNCDFHLKLCSFFDNEYMYDCLSKTLTSLGIAYVRSYWDAQHTTNILGETSDHRKLLRFMQKKDKGSAVKSLEEDILGFFSLGT